jgi:hypothetical protein
MLPSSLRGDFLPLSGTVIRFNPPNVTWGDLNEAGVPTRPLTHGGPDVFS